MSAVQPVFILVRPQMGENIGAAARAMLNFGLSHLRLVEPRDGWPNPRAVAMASGAAGRVLDHAGIFGDVATAAGDCGFLFATTARGRELTKSVMTPEAAMAHARELIGRGERVGVLFGPERAGLENDDLARASAVISVPVNPEFPSLNLAQAVLLCAYEWRKQDPDAGSALPAMGRGDLATRIEVERLGDHFEQELERAGFFFPETKAAGMRQNLRNLWSRMPLTRADVQTFHGMMRQIVRRRETGGDGGGNG